MTLYATDIGDEAFIRHEVPSLLSKGLSDALASRDGSAMDAYLRSEHSVGLSDVMRFACLSIEATKRGTMYMVGISDTAVEPKSGERISSLVRLVDFGNADVRGLGVMTQAVESLRSNFRQAYQMYQLRGGSESWR